MGEAKKFFERIGGAKKLRKDQCLILILAGVLPVSYTHLTLPTNSA